MGSNFNFKSFGYDPPVDGGGGSERPPGNFPLTLQSSVYSLTFDEFQSTVAGSGKDFGSMNMDELLKSIWSADENQNNGPSSGVGGSNAQEGLQRQGSLTLPTMISQKTVDEVWKDMSKEYGGAKDASGGIVGFGVPHREPTLGEITLEEFLARAGVVREEPQLNMKANNNDAIFDDFSCAVNNSGLRFGFQQQSGANNSNQMGIQSGNFPLNVNGVSSQVQQQAIREQPQQQQIIPKLSILSYGAPMGIPTSQLGSPRIRGGIAGISDQVINNTMVQNVALQGMVNMSVAAGSPAVSSDGITKSYENTPSASPVPCVFNGGLRGRKTAILEKVVERRQRRMIKNRESAARSRARKQAYTTELEAEVAKLKEENEELRKKQQEVMEMQKNEVLEMMNQRDGAKRRCLRRTQTGIW